MQQILSYVRRCVHDFNMIEDGEKIAVGVSGGKDSLTLLCALSRLSRFYPKRFTVEAISLDMGFPGADYAQIRALCERIAVPFTVVPTNIKEVIFDIRKEKNPCALCANMRRGALHDAALSRGCRKVALGHHRDDAVETMLLSLFYEGRIHCFYPVTYLDRKDITVIRPLLYTPEREVIRVARNEALPILHNPCPADKHTKREEVKTLIKTLEKDHPGLQERIFGAVRRYPLRGFETNLS